MKLKMSILARSCPGQFLPDANPSFRCRGKRAIVTDNTQGMEREAKIQLLWGGKVTVRKILSLLGQSAHIEIQLAPEYNHALFSRLHSAAAQAGAEDIDITGGPELLETVAMIKGLDALSELVEPLGQAGASVHVESPPRITIQIPDRE